jgi:hypothetical protein
LSRKRQKVSARSTDIAIRPADLHELLKRTRQTNSWAGASTRRQFLGELPAKIAKRTRPSSSFVVKTVDADSAALLPVALTDSMRVGAPVKSVAAGQRQWANAEWRNAPLDV